MLSLPAGRGGRRFPLPSWLGLIGELGCWREIAGISDGLLAAGGQGGDGGGSQAERVDGALA